MNRRRFLKYVGGVAGGGAAVAGLGYYGLRELLSPTTGTTAGTTFSATIDADLPREYREFLEWLATAGHYYAGRNINVSLESEATPRALQKLDADFFKACGINVQFDLKPYSTHLADISLMTRTQSPTYDAFTVDNQDIVFFRDAIISPTELADKYPDLTYEPINGDAFFGIPWALSATYPPSSLLSLSASSSQDTLFIPLDMPTMIHYYRGDVYADLGITPADTWEEYLEDMKVIARSRKTPFPTVTQAGATVSSVFEFLNHLASFGAELWSFDGEELVPQVDGDKAITALENYASLRTFADPASYTYSWQDVTKDLSRGIASSAIQWDDYSYWLDDPIRSQVPRKFQYKQNPSGPHGSFSTYGGAGIGVSRYSRNPEAAWLWLQWATGLGTQEAALLDVFRPFPSRKAVLELSEMKEFIEKGQYPSLTVAKEVWNSGGIVALFSFPKWWHLLDILSTHISKVWQGREQPRDALTLAQNQIQSWGSLTF